MSVSTFSQNSGSSLRLESQVTKPPLSLVRAASQLGDAGERLSLEPVHGAALAVHVRDVAVAILD